MPRPEFTTSIENFYLNATLTKDNILTLLRDHDVISRQVPDRNQPNWYGRFTDDCCENPAAIG